jgi:hypothetical protein
MRALFNATYGDVEIVVELAAAGLRDGERLRR